jgi:hypothetical protein
MLRTPVPLVNFVIPNVDDDDNDNNNDNNDNNNKEGAVSRGGERQQMNGIWRRSQGGEGQRRMV